MAPRWGCRDIRKNESGIMRNRITTLAEIGTSTFGVNSRSGGQAGVAGLGEVSNGWNILPGLDNASRAIPTNAANRNIGQDFSIALNDALERHGISGQVQNDGVISQFHVEQLGQLLLAPGVGSAFPAELASKAVKMISDSEFQKFAVLALTADEEMSAIIPRLKFASTMKPGGQSTAPANKKRNLALPIFAGLVGFYVLIARRY